MTARVMPLRQGVTLYQRYAARALAIAVVLHGLAIGIYFLVSAFVKEDEPVREIRRIFIPDFLPPSILEGGAQSQTGVKLEAARPQLGVPVPVPDAEVDPREEFTTQRTFPSIPSPFPGEGAEPVMISPPADDAEPDPIEFIAVEKSPVPVKIVPPDYPELARRAGVEGTVLVRALVDKEGKVRKAIIEKGDVEFFNDAAVSAAKQWVFTPALMNSGPVMVWISIPFRFRLNK